MKIWNAEKKWEKNFIISCVLFDCMKMGVGSFAVFSNPEQAVRTRPLLTLQAIIYRVITREFSVPLSPIYIHFEVIVLWHHILFLVFQTYPASLLLSNNSSPKRMILQSGDWTLCAIAVVERNQPTKPKPNRSKPCKSGQLGHI